MSIFDFKNANILSKLVKKVPAHQRGPLLLVGAGLAASVYMVNKGLEIMKESPKNSVVVA